MRITKNGDKTITESMENKEWPDGFWDIFTVDPDFEIPEPLPSKEFTLDE